MVACALCCQTSSMQQNTQELHWNDVMNQTGNTILHSAVAHLREAQSGFGHLIRTYKNAIKKEGANPDIKNNHGETAASLFRSWFKRKLLEAIDTHDNDNLHTLLLNAPELLETTQGLERCPLQYAIINNNLHAQACISYCLKHGKLQENYLTLFLDITDRL